jgi:hypothetical protein
MNLPVALTFERSPVAMLNFLSESAVFTMKDLKILLGVIKADLTLNDADQKWGGTWESDAITVTGTPAPVPPMKGWGTATVTENHVIAEGLFTSTDKTHKLEFKINVALNSPDQSVLTITAAQVPWKSGRISMRQVEISLAGTKPVAITLELEKVSLSELMQSLTGERVTATGVVSGTIPLIISRSGQITFKNGNLKADGPGTIQMPPDVVPGDNEQVELVRDILQDLRFNQFSISLETDDKNNLSVLMKVEGNNPAVYSGRPVKLNVHLTGDVLDFVRQNVMFFTDPQSLLKQAQ